MISQSYYEILGISRDATQATIKQAAQTQIDEIKTVFAILGDQEKRQAYDKSINKINTLKPIKLSATKIETRSHMSIRLVILILLLIGIGSYWLNTHDFISLKFPFITTPTPSVPATNISTKEKLNKTETHTAEVKEINEEKTHEIVTQPTPKSEEIDKKEIVAEENINQIESVTTTPDSKIVEQPATIPETTTEISQTKPIEIIETTDKPISSDNVVPIVETPQPSSNIETTQESKEPAKILENSDEVAETKPSVKPVTIVQELPIKILYKDWFEQNKVIALTIALTNNLNKSIQSFHGIITLYDLNDQAIGNLSLPEDGILNKSVDKNSYVIQIDKTKKWGLKVSLSQHQSLYSQLLNQRLTNLKIRFFLKEVTYSDGTIASF